MAKGSIHVILGVASVGLAAGAACAAQVTDEPKKAGDDIIVTGTRTGDRTRLQAVSPVDVISGTTLRERGTTELATALAQAAPSINFPRLALVGGSDSIRPATLRGLSPDQTLVLINGTRAHSSALLNINGSVGRGAAAVDLNTIPVTAIDRIEVLRDGASAQYGSDAIAGVINLRLKEARSGGGASISYGEYITEVNTARGSRDVRDGGTTTASAWQGFGLGSEGFLTVSGEYSKRNPTNRSDFDARLAVPAVTSRYGDPEVGQATGYVNAGVPLNDIWQLYGWAGYQYRTSESASYFRLASDPNNVAALFPQGLLPLTKITSKDLTSALGLRGKLADWTLDLNLSYGRNHLDLNGTAVNPTYGAASPTRFYLGALLYDQAVAGLDVSRKVPLGDASLNIALGAEYRREGFDIRAGQHESYDRGPLGGNPSLASGALSFVGFQPANALGVHRDNVSVYLDLEAKIPNGLTLGLAARAERYSDFGTTATGKLSARYDVADWLAVRGTISTGFRAPSLQQSYYTSTQSVAQVNQTILQTGTYPSTSPIAVALGGKKLEPEKSTNLSAGFVVRSGNFNLTVDAYRIRIRDQLALSENIQASASPQIAALLAPYGVQAARFFINGITSTTTGVDAVASYRLATDTVGRFDFSLSANLNHVKLNKVPTSTSTLASAPVLFGRSRILTFEQGTPRSKAIGSVGWTLGRLGATARVTYYHSILQAADIPAFDLATGNRAIADLELRYRLGRGINIAFGADNVLDTYPRAAPASVNGPISVLGFPFGSPFGFNGRYVYGRLSVTW